MKKRLLSLLLALLICLTALPTSAAAADTVTINVYNWGQYIADGTDDSIDVIEAFEEAYPNIKVNYMTFDSNESMYTKLKAGGSSFDIIIPSDYMIDKLIQEDMLEELDFSNIPNYETIDEGFKNLAYDPENRYSVPYTWGTVGIIYNTKYVDPADVTGWEIFGNEKYAGKILMFDNPRDAFAIAQLELGYDINTEDSVALGLAAQLLRDQKPLVQAYVMDQIFDKMERAEAWIAPYYAGDYLTMVEENPDLEFYFPEEGYNLFVDAICIPKGAEHKKEAELFINFLISPEICAQNLEFLGYSAPSSAAKALMDPETAENPVAYPSDEVLARGVAFRALSETATQEMNTLWLTVKTADTATTVYLILTAVAAVGVAVLWLYAKMRRRVKKARRCAKWKISS